MDEQARDFYRKVREGYRELACVEPARFRVIDATASIEEVAQTVWKVLSPILSH
jgi:thymidylate kinase